MELLEILFAKAPMGFGKAQEPQRLAGVRFADGKIAYQDADGVIRATESEKKLREALPGAVLLALVPPAPAADNETEVIHNE